jgi:hypothetical protein
LKSYDPRTYGEVKNILSLEISREKRKLEKIIEYHKSVGWTSRGENQVNRASGSLIEPLGMHNLLFLNIRILLE